MLDELEQMMKAWSIFEHSPKELSPAMAATKTKLEKVISDLIDGLETETKE